MSAATPTSPAIAATRPFAPAPMPLTASSSAPRPRAMMATSAPEVANRWRSQGRCPSAAGDHGRAADETDFHSILPKAPGPRARPNFLPAPRPHPQSPRRGLLRKQQRSRLGRSGPYAEASDPAAVICPLQQRLTLPRPAQRSPGSQFRWSCAMCRRIAFHRLIWRSSSAGMRRPK